MIRIFEPKLEGNDKEKWTSNILKGKINDKQERGRYVKDRRHHKLGAYIEGKEV